jgi:hypothetical protein
MVEALFLKVFERFGWRIERIAQLEWTIARYLAGSFQRKLPFTNSHCETWRTPHCYVNYSFGAPSSFLQSIEAQDGEGSFLPVWTVSPIRGMETVQRHEFCSNRHNLPKLVSKFN